MAALPKEPSTDQIKRLTYSKYLLNRSRELRQLGNELATAQAVLLGHDAAEMAMHVVADFVGAHWKSEKFLGFWESVATATKGDPPPSFEALKSFNNLRVGFKHHGNLPHSDAANYLLPVVENFCREITKRFLNTDFDSISLADLIPNDEARKQAKKAEATFTNGDVAQALVAIKIAFKALGQEADSKLGLAVEGSTWKWPGLPYELPREVQEVVDRLDPKGLEGTLQKLADATNSLALGISPQELKRFQRLTPYVRLTSSGEPFVTWPHDSRKLGKAEFDFCLSFVVDLGLRLATVS